MVFSETNGVRNYFDRIPGQWDALYSHENRLRYALNRLLRRDLFERYELTFSKCGSIAGATVLDIGCGTGRYSIEFARRGAARVLGIDFAAGMISFSERLAGEMGVGDRCEFVCADFLTHSIREQFDIVLAVGFFDYVPEAEPLFRKIEACTRSRFLASFPTYSALWGLQRKIRYEWVKRCPIYYYTVEQLQRLYITAGFPVFEIVPTRRGLFGVGSKE